MILVLSFFKKKYRSNAERLLIFSARSRGMTLLEMLAAISIVLILGAMIYPAIEGISPRAERVVCENNLRNLRVAFSDYSMTGWPQIPDSMAIGSLAEQQWWLDKTKKDLGLAQKSWQCPTLLRMFRKLPEKQRPLVHYLPTPFSGEPNKANTWPQMPWFIEIGDAHGCGVLLVRQNGTVEPAPK
jgi:prepilin-type N-terminal cleavage/methylation domain-containing protein